MPRLLMIEDPEHPLLAQLNEMMDSLRGVKGEKYAFAVKLYTTFLNIQNGYIAIINHQSANACVAHMMTEQFTKEIDHMIEAGSTSVAMSIINILGEPQGKDESEDAFAERMQKLLDEFTADALMLHKKQKEFGPTLGI